MATNMAGDSSNAMASVVNLKLRGLQRPVSQSSTGDEDGSQAETFEQTLSLAKDAPVSALWDKIKELGYGTPIYLLRDGSDRKWQAGAAKPTFKEFELIEVVGTESSDPTKTIHIDDRLIAYANRRFGQPISLNVAESETELYGVQTDSLKDSRGLQIVFHRTVRMPDDDKIHQLPGSLGALPLFSVASFADRLPEKIVKEGGVFLPMWQREALWIGLECVPGVRYALRICVGRINAVSGAAMAMDGEPTEEMSGEQDYVVVPGQEWIDGICVAPGIVRQFVAMPLGSGYTVEGQKTGEEKHGGLQMEIIPSFETALRTWSKDTLSPPNPADFARKDETQTPGQLGFRVGDKFRLHPKEAIEYVPCTISDIVGDQQLDPEIVLTSKYEYASVVLNRFMSNGRPMGAASSERERRPFAFASPPTMASNSAPEPAYSVSGFERYSDAGMEYAGELLQSSSNNVSDGDLYWSELAAEKAEMNCDYAADEVSRAGSAGTGQLMDTREEEPAIPPVKTTDLKAMGLAAGGKLIQDIYRDYNQADIWNTEAAKLVNIHILDPASCEAVTHVVPPPPPIDAMGYVEEGGAFYVVEEQPENRVDAGEFEGVKSVSAMDKHKGLGLEPSLDPTQQTQCKCAIRLCDCVVRPCNHQFCNVCVREMDPSSLTSPVASAEPSSTKRWFCPTCKAAVSYVAGFSAPMNLPGEESLKVRVPVHVLEVKDGRVQFKGKERSRI